MENPFDAFDANPFDIFDKPVKPTGRSQAQSPKNARLAKGRALTQKPLPMFGTMGAARQLMASPVGPLLLGANQGLSDIGAGAVDIVGRLTGSKAMSNAAQGFRDAVSDVVAPSRQTNEQLFQAGRFAGQVAPTFAIGSGMARGAESAARVVPKAAPFLNNAATALRSGGFTGGGKGLAGVATRAGAGATVGGTTAALVNPDDAATGALIGAAIPVVGSGAAKLVGGTVDKIMSGLTGKYGVERARTIFREALGADYDRAIAALRNAPDSMTTAQALQAAGIENDVLQAVADKVATGQAFRTKLDAQQATRASRADFLAGGGNATLSREAQKADQNALNRLTTPLREQELALANTAGQVTNRLAPQIQQFEQAAAQNVDDVRRMGQATDRFNNMQASVPPARSFADDMAGAPTGPSSVGVPVPLNVSRMTELAKNADEAATQAAERSNLFGSNARSMQMRLDSLAKNGLKPLNTNKITQSLREAATRVGDRADPVRVEAMNDIAAMIDDLKNQNGGVIDARDLYELRKTAVNDRLTQLMSSRGFDASTSKKRVAQLLSPINKLIDDAIQEAGGTQWANYLNKFSSGMLDVERKKFAAEASLMMKTSPNDFVRLIGGDNPEAVEAIFGPNRFNLQKMLSPAQFRIFRQNAAEIVRDQKMKEMVESGAPEAVAILEKNKGWLRIPNMLNPKITVLNAAMSALDNLKLQPATEKALRDGFLSGKSALQILKDVPAPQVQKAMPWLTNPRFWNQAAILAASEPPKEKPSQNALASLPP